MIRTIELILGLPPLSQFDAAATPMFASFTDKADLTPYTARAGPDRPGRHERPRSPTAPSGRAGWTSASTTRSTTSSSTRSSGAPSRARTPRCRRPSAGPSPIGRPDRKTGPSPLRDPGVDSCGSPFAFGRKALPACPPEFSSRQQIKIRWLLGAAHSPIALA